MSQIDWAAHDSALLGSSQDALDLLRDVFGASSPIVFDHHPPAIEDGDAVAVLDRTPWRRLKVREAVDWAVVWDPLQDVPGVSVATVLEHALDLAAEVTVVRVACERLGELLEPLAQLDVREQAVVPFGSSYLVALLHPSATRARRREVVRALRAWAGAGGDPGLRSLRLLRFAATRDTEPVTVRDDLRIQCIADPEPVALTSPLTGVPLPGAQDEYVALPVFVAEVRRSLVAPARGIVLTERDELIHESAPNDGAALGLLRDGDLLDWPALRAGADLLGGPHLVLANSRVPNYYHWWIDSLSRVWLTDTYTSWSGCPLLLGGEVAPFQLDLLDRLGLGARLVTSEAPLVMLEQAVVSGGLALASAMRMSPLIAPFAAWARSRLGVRAQRPQRRLLVSRAGALGRRIVNEDEVFAALAPHGFERVRLEQLNVVEQATAFAEAELIVAPHGAGLTNLLFAPSGTAVVELFSRQDAHDSTYRRFAGLLGHVYGAVVGETPDAARANKADMVIDAAHLASVLDEGRALRPAR